MDHNSQVLVIEDNPGDADLVRLRLSQGHYAANVNCVNRLSEGLASLTSATPSVILLDLNLPDSHGAETFRRIHDHSPNVPIVVLTGQDDQSFAEEAVHQGVQDYLLKSDMNSKTLERAIRYAVQRQAVLRASEIEQKQQLIFRDQFLSHVSHELRTPLSVIHQYVSLMVDGLVGPLSPDQSDHLKTVLKSANQLNAMLRDLMESTRAEAGKMRIAPRCISLGELVHQTVDMMKPAADAKNLTMEMAVDIRLPLVYADPDRVLEVLINLLDNAVKFTPRSGTIIVQGCSPNADTVEVSVTNTGQGMTPETKARIFERLYQSQDSLDQSGLGLGLFICKQIVQLHGGQITVSSEPGQGATFTFTLPTYSLAKVIAPVVTRKDLSLAPLVLLQLRMKPISYRSVEEWTETLTQYLEVVRRCVRIDKDLVLPQTATSGSVERVFILVSTDLEKSEIITNRIREHLERIPDFKTTCALSQVAMPVHLSSMASGQSPEERVQCVADALTEMIKAGVETPHSLAPKNSHTLN
jgi:signal transduction histidine kinase